MGLTLKVECAVPVHVDIVSRGGQGMPRRILCGPLGTDTTRDAIAEFVGTQRSQEMESYIVTAANSYQQMREALQAVLANPIISGMSARIRDDARQAGKANPLDLVQAALSEKEPT